MPAMTLYYSPNSPFARKVRIVLREKGRECREVVVDTNNLPADYAGINPNLRVPALQDGRTTLFESNLIVDYLLRTYPGGDGQPALASSLTRSEQHWGDSLLLTTIETLLDSAINIYQFHRNGILADQSAYLKKEHSRTQSCLDWLEARATPEGIVPGVFSIQDLNLVCALTWIEFRKPVAWAGRPKLAAIVARYAERPSVRATQPA
jgi:glutathione S-transferase